MQTRDYLIILYDYYGDLLKDDLKKVFEDYYFDNLSLKEIADNYNISRNAVHKRIKSVEEKLLFYEEKLKLRKKEESIDKKINEIKDEKLKKYVENIVK